ncbi:MAG: anti-sigma factor [Chloroflexi bacterium]|nr:anti-sigma factor [Chloroflexota bacterium]
MTNDCDHIARLASGWALGALDPDEADDLRRHLASCGRSHDELREALAVAAALGDAVPRADTPSPALRSRVVAAARADGDDRATTAIRAVIPPAATARRGLPWRSLAVGASALAVAASLALAVLVGETGALRDRIAQLEAERVAVSTDLASARSWIDRAVARGASAYFMKGEGDARQASFMLVVEPDAAGAMLLMSGLPALSRDQTYELWVERDGEVVGVGTFRPDAGGLAAVAIDDSLVGIRHAMVTVEPDGGSTRPSGGDVVMQGELGI